MARKRKTNIAKALERSPAPVYLLKADLTILDANPACYAWVGLEPEQMIGAQALYLSDAEPGSTEAALSGLSPPPDRFEPPSTHPPDLAPQGSEDKGSEDGSPALPPRSFFQGESFHFYISRPHPTDSTKRVWRRATGTLVPSDETEPMMLVVASTDDRDRVPHDFHDPADMNRSHRLHVALQAMRQTLGPLVSLDGLVGESLAAQRLRKQARLASQVDCDLLIVGPPGSGREYVARAIDAARDASSENVAPQEANRPLQALSNEGKRGLFSIDCEIADQELVQSVIGQALSQTRPAAHSADASPRGRDQGRLLLLNVDQLSPACQAELLGFLRLPHFSLVMLATATTLLHDAVERGAFSRELANYLGTITLELPPLSQRPEDIPVLAQAMLERQNTHRENPLSGFDSEAMAQLEEFWWPGNLDQLGHVIREAAQRSRSRVITASDLPKKFHDGLLAQRMQRPAETTIVLDDYLQAIEKELVVRAIEQARGNKTKAAQLLGISRAKLIRRTQAFGLELDVAIASNELEEITTPDFEEIE